MKCLFSVSALLLLASVWAALSTPAFAQYYDMPHPNERPVSFSPRAREPMPMMRYNARQEHRRQSAKCMNAYPEDHSGFTDCIENENAASPYRQERMQFVPMSPSQGQ